MGKVVNIMVRCGADFSGLSNASQKVTVSMSSMQKAAEASVKKLEKDLTKAQTSLQGYYSKQAELEQSFTRDMAKVNQNPSKYVRDQQTAVLEEMMATDNENLDAQYADKLESLEKVQTALTREKERLAEINAEYQRRADISGKAVQETEKAAQQATTWQSRVTQQINNISQAAETTAARQRQAVQQSGQAQANVAGSVKRGWQKAFAEIDNSTAKSSGLIKSRFQKSFDAVGKSVHHFGSRLKEIVLGSLIFNGISAALRKLTSYLSTSVMKAEEMKTAMANLKGAAATATAPLIQALTPALAALANAAATVLSYLSHLISLITGKSVYSMAAVAESMASTGKAASGAARDIKEANRSLAGFDEISKLNEKPESSGGGASTQEISPNYNFSADCPFLDSVIKKVNDSIETVKTKWSELRENVDPGVTAWSNTWTSISTTAETKAPKVGAAATSLWDTALHPLIKRVTEEFAPQMFNSWSEAFAPIMGGAVSTGITVFSNRFQTICKIVGEAINDVVTPALESFVQIWDDIMDGIEKGWSQYGEPVMNGIVEVCEKIDKIYLDLWQKTLSPFIQDMIARVKRLWETSLKPLWDNIVKFIGSVIQWVLTWWNEVMLPFFNWIVNTFGPPLSAVFSTISQVAMNMVSHISDGLSILLSALSGILDFMSKVFQGDWEGAWKVVKQTVADVWEGIVRLIKNRINSVIGFINRMISGAVSGINSIISAINKISFTMPSWIPGIGGRHFSFNIRKVSTPQIPMLAKGAVIPPNKEFMAVLGDQKHGTNIEAPTDLLRQIYREELSDLIASNMAGHEATVSALRDILEAVLGITIGDEMIAGAVTRHQTKLAIMNGGGV